MPTTRSAHHTINGYKYQFDKSIIELCKADPLDELILEGVEDVDVPGELIQCKYHESIRYVPSAIRKPIGEFLKHFAANIAAPPRYRLYAHFSEPAQAPVLDLAALKRVLGDVPNPHALTDADLLRFLQSHLVFELGPAINEQERLTKLHLKQRLQASDVDCEHYLYPNALAYVLRIARQSTLASRTTTALAFTSSINTRGILLNEWLSELKGAQDFTAYCRHELEARDANAPRKERILYLCDSFCGRHSPVDIATHIEQSLAAKYAMGHAMRNAKPPIFVLDCDELYVKQVKSHLLDPLGIPFTDGYEHVNFNRQMFVRPPDVIRVTRGKVVTERIASSSIHVRLVRLSTLAATSPPPLTADALVCVADNGLCPPCLGASFVFHIPSRVTLGQLWQALK